jgi:glucose/arabinose dehydrogenase
MLRRFLAAAAIALVASPAAAQLKIQPFVTGLSVPVAFIQDPTDSTVQYVVQQNGHIRVVKSGAVQPTDFLDLSGSISGGGERGLLGLAFEPGDATDRRFYVYYTNTDGNIVIARYLRSTGNRLVADPAQHLELQWPDGNRFIPHQGASNHNGGTLAFGPDGYLYIGVGDGGGGNDTFRNAQNAGTLLGKMLRIDVRVALGNTKGYAIPPDNPFLDNVPIPALGEIWSFGLRTRNSASTVRCVGTRRSIGDAPELLEVDYEPPNRGRNYGWAFRRLPPSWAPGARPRAADRSIFISTPGISSPAGLNIRAPRSVRRTQPVLLVT